MGGRNGRLVGGGRGQTTLDFTIGVSVFIIAVVFVLTFIPSMFEPFARGTQSNTVVADRLATQLSTGMLTSPETPFTLSVACTSTFVNLTTPPAECSFSGATLHERLGLNDRQTVNVSVTGDVDGDGIRSVLCRTTESHIAEKGTSSCQTLLAAGKAGDASGTATVAWRAVEIGDQTAMLEVRLWD